MSTRLFSLGKSQPPKCLIGWESCDSDGRYWKQSRNVAPCPLTPEGGGRTENSLVLCFDTIQKAALTFEPNAAPYIDHSFTCPWMSWECYLKTVPCFRLGGIQRGIIPNFPWAKELTFLRISAKEPHQSILLLPVSVSSSVNVDVSPQGPFSLYWKVEWCEDSL